MRNRRKDTRKEKEERGRLNVTGQKVRETEEEHKIEEVKWKGHENSETGGEKRRIENERFDGGDEIMRRRRRKREVLNKVEKRTHWHCKAIYGTMTSSMVK